MTGILQKVLFYSRKQMGSLSPMEELLGFCIKDNQLFERAFTHKGSQSSYERLEFLGDAVLDSVISDWLFHLYPSQNEGDLTVLRARYVSRVSLAKFAQILELHKFIISDRVSFKHINENNKRILGDVLESLIGAIYLERGYEGAEQFIHQNLLTKKDLLQQIDDELKNYKGILLEQSQTHDFKVLFEFEPYNGEYYLVSLYIDDKKLAYGRGKNKKKAEQSACRYIINHPHLLREFLGEE